MPRPLILVGPAILLFAALFLLDSPQLPKLYGLLALGAAFLLVLAEIVIQTIRRRRQPPDSR